MLELAQEILVDAPTVPSVLNFSGSQIEVVLRKGGWQTQVGGHTAGGGGLSIGYGSHQRVPINTVAVPFVPVTCKPLKTCELNVLDPAGAIRPLYFTLQNNRPFLNRKSSFSFVRGDSPFSLYFQ